jgi:hypothetical protein
MLTKNFLFKFVALILVVLSLVGLPAGSYAAGNDTWQPKLPPAGLGSVVFVNHIGQGGELTVDLEGTIYTVSEKANDIPGRLQLNLAPGTYAFTANIPNTGIASRTVEVVAGKVIALNFVGVGSQLVVHNSGDSDKGTSRSYKNTDLTVVYDDISNQAR